MQIAVSVVHLGNVPSLQNAYRPELRWRNPDRATERRTLGPRETYTFSYTYPVEPSFEKGIYRFRVSATNPAGTSRATARIEIF